MLSIVLMLLSTPAHAKYPVFIKCPEGTRITSKRLDSGTEVFCTKVGSNVKDGPYARFDARGKRTHDGIYEDGVLVIRAYSFYDLEGHLVKRQMIRGDGDTKELQTVMIYWDKSKNAVTKIRAQDFDRFKEMENSMDVEKLSDANSRYVPISKIATDANVSILQHEATTSR